MTQLRKFVNLLILLDKDTRHLLLEQFDNDHGEMIVRELADLPLTDLDLQTQILREFTEFALQANAALGGSVEYTRAVLEKGFGLGKAAEIIGRIAARIAAQVVPGAVVTSTAQTPLSPLTIQRIVGELDAAKSNRFIELGHQAPERIMIEVLRQLTRENPFKMSVAARTWALGKLNTLQDQNLQEKTPLSVVQRIAALLILLGEDTASLLLSHFDETQTESIALEMANLRLINLEAQTTVLKEFTEMALREYSANVSKVTSVPSPVQVVEPGVGKDIQPHVQEVEELQAAKSELALDYWASHPAPERIAIEVLKQLIRAKPDNISQAARNWLLGNSEKSMN